MSQDAHDQVLITLRRIIQAIDIHSRSLKKKSGLTTPQLLIMQAISKLGVVPIRALATQVNLSQATVTTIIDRLEAHGLVSRERSQEDKRKVHALLTDKGRQLLEQAPEPMQAHFVSRFKELPEWEKGMLVASLQRLADLMDAPDADDTFLTEEPERPQF
ncbi:MarR family transcriptional regulator [Pokkaliibacter sp. MBI-7]|uniref:MarR family winged helix-turn-helix transcriptional regulator n=1 Tax=Pokkaliibacter sp. MBI-7 TaxID=3040600 RepID=UPI002449322B|nr:MarR family transcriptional regulator [Pokkaliibacter sp. MBI-7]MDH2433233.1 MarR family transcriptional regulator [Pokkaliibacter sp. MBI-7]